MKSFVIAFVLFCSPVVAHDHHPAVVTIVRLDDTGHGDSWGQGAIVTVDDKPVD